MASLTWSQHRKQDICNQKRISDELRQALSALLPELRGFARFLVQNRAEADDLVQEALLRALRSLDQFHVRDDPKRNLRAWVFTILRNVHVEQRRRQRSETAALARQNLPDASVGPAQHGNSDSVDLERQLWRLSPVLREALILVGAQGLDYEEAATVCGIPVGTMKARVSRARRLLAEALAPVAHS